MVIPYLLEDWQREADIVTMDEHCVVKAIGNYILKQTLGKGSMGKVKLGIHIVTGEKTAIKIVPRATRNRKLTPKELSRELRAIREGHLMMLLNHPHIVYLRDMVAGSHHYYFMMDYVSGGQLLHYIVKRSYLTEQHARHFCRQMVSALDYMHRNSVVHRDLKIENILVDSTGRNIKIIDFGLSNLFCPERQLTTYCGSLYFAAPELLNGRPYRGPEIDVWSLGVVLYVMVTGSVPFDDKSLPGLHEKIKRAQVAYPAHLSSQCHQLLSTIFVAEPQQRITLADIIRHPWLNDGHSRYIRNHLPFREPLCLPLDENVLKRMTYGFSLGTTDDIRMKMEVILQSSVYRISATHVSDIQSLSLNNQKNSSNSSINNNSFSSSTSLFMKSCNRLSGKKSCKRATNNKDASHMIWGSYNDPQTVPAAYHPLLSIYYLTRERMERIEDILTPRKHPPMEPASSSPAATSKPTLSSLENTMEDIQSKHLASSQQPNQMIKNERDDSECSKRHIHTKQHQPDYCKHRTCNLPPSTSPLHAAKTSKQSKSHHHQRLLTSSSSSSTPGLAVTSSLVSSALSSSSSTHSTLSFNSALKAWTTSSSSSSTTLPLPQTLGIIDSNNINTTRSTLPFSSIKSTTATTKRKIPLFLKLGAFFRRTQKNRSQKGHNNGNHHRRKKRQQRHRHHCDVVDRHYQNAKVTHRRRSSQASDTSLYDEDQQQQPLVPSTSIHERNTNTHHVSLLSPTASSVSSDSTKTPRLRPMPMTPDKKHNDSDGNGTETTRTNRHRHERTPSWLSRRLSTWMDNALLLNRSTSGLGQTRRN